MKLNCQGQNIIEYTLLVIAVILVFLVILNPQGGLIKSSVETTLNKTVEMINNTTREIILPP